MDASSADPPDDSEENVLVKLASLAVPGAGLLALFSGQSRFWIVFAVLVPIVKVVTDEFGVDVGAEETRRGERAAPESKQDALDALRNRYARGELSESEFEREVETLLETETLEGARERVGRERGAEADRETDAETESETHAETERESSPDAESATERR